MYLLVILGGGGSLVVLFLKIALEHFFLAYLVSTTFIMSHNRA